jgi:hypothetical protein
MNPDPLRGRNKRDAIAFEYRCIAELRARYSFRFSVPLVLNGEIVVPARRLDLIHPREPGNAAAGNCDDCNAPVQFSDVLVVEVPLLCACCAWLRVAP